MPDSPLSWSRNKRRGKESMLTRAGNQAGEGAEKLFNRLDAMNNRQERSAQLLARLAERVRAGEWTPELAALVAQAEALDTDSENPATADNR